MTFAPAKDEALRLASLERYEVPGGASDPAIDDITALARDVCQTKLAGVSMIGADKIYLPSRAGPGPAQLLRGGQPCETAILGDSVFEIGDARYHKDYSPDGILVAGRAFRFYAGAPLITPEGIRVGCLLVQDPRPKTLTEVQRRTLQVLASQVITRYELSARTRSMERDGRARQRVESALTVERNFVSTVLDTVGALVAVFDTAGRVVRFNRACERVSGYDFHSMAGRYVWEKLIAADDIGIEKDTFEWMREGGLPAEFENFWRHRNGTLRRIAWSATALTDAQGDASFIIATGIDVTEQRAAEATLRESEERYRQLVEGSLGMVCTHDLEGTLLSVNVHGAKSIGFSVEEVTGRKLLEFMPVERQAGFESYLREVMATGEAQGRMHLVHRDGGERVVAFRNKRIEVPEHESYVLGFGVDVSEQVQAEERLRALDRMKDEFISTVSHELRTPLTSLRAAVGLLASGALDDRPEKRKQMLGIAAGNTDRLVRLVNDILDIERTNSGQAELARTMCRADDLLQRAAELQQAAAWKRGLQFRVAAGAVEVWADADRILQALANLISNAIKFSPEGGDIALSARATGGGEAEIVVSDQGRGVPADKLEVIFERFQQVDASDSRAMGGTGLGLAISRSILVQHGGRIWATSPPGAGAAFHFTLPTSAEAASC